jgi:hypothetical protein
MSGRERRQHRNPHTKNAAQPAEVVRQLIQAFKRPPVGPPGPATWKFSVAPRAKNKYVNPAVPT